MLVDQAPYITDFAKIWRATDKIIYSQSLQSVSSAQTQIKHDFDPNSIHELKTTAKHDITVSNPKLAAEVLKTGLVNEIQLFLNPIVISADNPALPDDVRLQLKLLDERRFANNVIYLRYRTTN